MDLTDQEDEPLVRDNPETTNLRPTTSAPSNPVPSLRRTSNRQRKLPVRYRPYVK